MFVVDLMALSFLKLFASLRTFRSSFEPTNGSGTLRHWKFIDLML